ncbi:MAG: DNA polymerase I [Phycisphaerales bacterium]|nr:DNA polymerase I [Phycisphaerales bacterium]
MNAGAGPTLYIIDGHAQMFRAFHAIRTPMSSPVTKEPTNATFGFVGMLLKILRTYRPDYLVVVVDAAGDHGTFRSEIYPEYKKNREPPPQALEPQVDRCVALLREIGAPVLGIDRVEADDTIATLVRRLERERPELKIRIVSKDKDLQQLLREGRVEMFDVHTDEAIDEARLRAEKGVTPAQVVDMLALMGDTVDNVPGVEGVGPKTAAELISHYGTLDNLLAHAAEIKGKRGEKIREAAPRLGLSRELVRLRDDVAFEFNLEQAGTAGLRLEALGPMLRELGFNRYQDDVKALMAERSGGGPSEAASAPPPPPAKRAAGGYTGGLFDDVAAREPSRSDRPAADYRCVRTMADMDELLRAVGDAGCVSIDTETTGLSPLDCALCGVSVSVRPGQGWYVPLRSPEPGSHLSPEEVVRALGPALGDARVRKCGHNLKFDLLVLRNAGIELRGMAFDSMVASYLVDSSRSSHSLDALALGLLGYSCIPIKDLIGTGKEQRTFDCVPLDLATEYAAEDADVALRLREALAPQLDAMGLGSLFDDVEMPLVGVLAELEWNGIHVDPEELDRQAARLNARIEELRRKIHEAAPRPFNPDSPKQLAEILFNDPDDEPPGLGIAGLKKTKTGYSTDIEVLEKLAADPSVTSPVPALIVEYRQLTKLVGTYLVALKEAINRRTGRVHASFHQTVAATGRLSSSDPNLQNIPIRSDIGRDIRRAFTAEPGNVLISADYSQIELRMLAHLSQDPGLIRAFEEGQDIHRAVAAQIHGVRPEDVTREQRDGAKMVNFGIVYGITAYGLARRLQVSDKEAAQIIDDYKRRFSGITTFLQECVEQATRLGYVETILKRRRPVPQVMSRNPSERALGERVAINSVVQGSAADLIKLAMLDLHARLSAHAPERLRSAPEIPGVRMLLQIHDELVFEAPGPEAARAQALIVERMERAMALRVPLKVEAARGRTWFENK